MNYANRIRRGDTKPPRRAGTAVSVPDGGYKSPKEPASAALPVERAQPALRSAAPDPAAFKPPRRAADAPGGPRSRADANTPRAVVADAPGGPRSSADAKTTRPAAMRSAAGAAIPVPDSGTGTAQKPSTPEDSPLYALAVERTKKRLAHADRSVPVTDSGTGSVDKRFSTVPGSTVNHKTGFGGSEGGSLDDPVPMNTLDKIGYVTGKFDEGVLRASQNAAQSMNKLFYDILSTTSDAFLGPVFPGLGKYLKNIADDSYNVDIFGADRFQQYFDDTFEGKEVSDALELAGEVSGSLGSMSPSIAAGNIAGAAGAGSTMVKGLQMALLGTSAAGSAAKEAISEGATPDKAFEYGLFKGLLEVCTENLFSGVAGLSETGVMNKLMDGLRKNGTLRFATDVLGEGAENVLTDFLTPYVKRMVYDPSARNATVGELLQSAASGAFLSAVTKLGAAGVNKLSEWESPIGRKVDYAADRAEFDALRRLGIGDLPLSIGDYVALKHGDAERWNEFVRRATGQNPQAVEVLQGRALFGGDAATANEGYRSTEAEEADSRLLDNETEREYNLREKATDDEMFSSTGSEESTSTNNRHSNWIAGDPIRLISGPISKTHPEIMESIVHSANEYGVEVITSNEGNISYSPGLRPGQPGQLHLNPNNSYGAWLHEYRHMLDDANDGWPGFEGLMNPKRRIKMECEAYAIEIKIAEDMGRSDIANTLRELRDQEIHHIVSELGAG